MSDIKQVKKKSEQMASEIFEYICHENITEKERNDLFQEIASSSITASIDCSNKSISNELSKALNSVGAMCFMGVLRYQCGNESRVMKTCYVHNEKKRKEENENN